MEQVKVSPPAFPVKFLQEGGKTGRDDVDCYITMLMGNGLYKTAQTLITAKNGSDRSCTLCNSLRMEQAKASLPVFPVKFLQEGGKTGRDDVDCYITMLMGNGLYKTAQTLITAKNGSDRSCTLCNSLRMEQAKASLPVFPPSR